MRTSYDRHIHTDAWLRDEIKAVESVSPSTSARLGAGWRSDRAAQLAHLVIDRFGRLARRFTGNPVDAAAAAFDVWMAAGFDLPESAWAFTEVRVKHLLSNEMVGELFCTGTGDTQVDAVPPALVNADGTRSSRAPIRWDHNPEDAIAILEAPTGGSTGRVAIAVATTALVKAGLHYDAATDLLDAIVGTVLGHDFERRVGRPAGASNRSSAVEKLRVHRPEIARQLGVSEPLVAEAVRLLIGTRDRGCGLVEREADGASFAELTAAADALMPKLTAAR